MNESCGIPEAMIEVLDILKEHGFLIFKGPEDFSDL